MPTNGLIVIAPVREGMEEALCEALNTFGNDIQGRGTNAGSQARIGFTDSNSIHFARLVLMDDPDRGIGRKRLLFATDYDGEQEDHTKEVIGRTKRPEAIWGCCEGYEGVEHFAEFIRAHAIKPDTYYIAFRGEGVPHLRACNELNEFFQRWLANPEAKTVFRKLPGIIRAGRGLQKVIRILWMPFDVLFRAILAGAEVLTLMARLGARNVFQAAMQINATLDRVWWVHALNYVFNNRAGRAKSLYSQASPNPPPNPIPAGYPPEDAILQNQLSLVTEVKPESLARLRAVLALIDLYGRRLSSPGSLVGISTIHTVRWVILDGGKRMLMVSNYDGTWENYIDEFAEMILSGLDALWTTAPDFPLAGAHDVAALKQFLRGHQVPANVFYSAYPAASVLNLKDNLQFAFWFGTIIRRLSEGRTCETSPAPALR